MSVLCQPATSICPNTTAINPPCAKISAAEAAEHLPAQIFKKAAYVKRRRQIVSLLGCGWRQILGR